MEEYFDTQIRDGEYDLLANLAILKLSVVPALSRRSSAHDRYQFNPQMSNPDVIINILLKSLSSTVQGPDFNLCLSLLREPSVSLRSCPSQTIGCMARHADPIGDPARYRFGGAITGRRHAFPATAARADKELSIHCLLERIQRILRSRSK